MSLVSHLSLPISRAPTYFLNETCKCTMRRQRRLRVHFLLQSPASQARRHRAAVRPTRVLLRTWARRAVHRDARLPHELGSQAAWQRGQGRPAQRDALRERGEDVPAGRADGEAAESGDLGAGAWAREEGDEV